MKGILDYVKKEPAVLLALLGAAISLAAAFGFDLSAEQTAAITAFAVVVLGIVTRQSVTPNVKVDPPAPEIDWTLTVDPDVPRDAVFRRSPEPSPDEPTGYGSGV